jgi:hypothetical protein
MLLLNGSAILSWASRPVFGSGRANDGPAVEKASLVHPAVVGPFPDLVEIKVSANYEREYSSIDAGLNKPPEKLSDAPNSPKNQVPHVDTGSRQILSPGSILDLYTRANSGSRRRSVLFGKKFGSMDECSKSGLRVCCVLRSTVLTRRPHLISKQIAGAAP